MKKIMTILAALATLGLYADMPYSRGENLLRNGELKSTKDQSRPDEWQRRVIPDNAKHVLKRDGDSWQMYFLPNQENISQVRIVQFNIKTEPGHAYEVEYEAKTGPGVSMRRDSFLLGIGVWTRFFVLPPLPEWTKCRNVFWIPQNVPEKGDVVFGMQNRSLSPVWYRNASLRQISIKENEVENFSPSVRLLPLMPEDALVMPDTRKEYLQYVIAGIPDNCYNDFSFEIRLYKNDNDYVLGKINGKRVEVPLKDMSAGISTFQLLVFDKRDKALVATSKIEIERIDKLPDNINFDNPVFLKTPKGDTFFPIGVYAGLGWKFSLQKLKDCGFNTIHTYGTDSWVVREENFKLLNDAAKLNLWILMGLPPRFQKQESSLESLSNWIAAYKKYPAVLAYYTDEIRMAGAKMDLVKKNYQTTRKADPTRQHYMYDKPEYGLGETTDCLMIDLKSKNLAKVIKLRMGDIPIIHVFGNVDFKNSTASSLDYNQSNFVMPIIWGASGVFYFTLRNLENADHNLEYKALAPRVLNSFKRFSEIAPAIISGEALPDWTKSIKYEGAMEHKIFANQGNVYIFCGVAADAQENGKISFTVPVGKKLRDVLNDQALSTGNFSLELSSGQGRIFEVK